MSFDFPLRSYAPGYSLWRGSLWNFHNKHELIEIASQLAMSQIEAISESRSVVTWLCAPSSMCRCIILSLSPISPKDSHTNTIISRSNLCTIQEQVCDDTDIEQFYRRHLLLHRKSRKIGLGAANTRFHLVLSGV